MSGGGGAAPSGGRFAVHRLSPERAGDFLTLFDRAFPDNPDWSGCYCRFYHCPESPWDSTPAAAARHRQDAAQAIAAGLQAGFLAYPADDAGRGSEGVSRGGGARPAAGAVGWLNAGPRAGFSNPRGYDAQGGGADAWAKCFVVAPAWRGQGVAGALLESALAALRSDGVRSIEAFPQAVAPAVAERFAAGSYKGPLSLYERLGFRREAELPHGRLRVRLDL